MIRQILLFFVLFFGATSAHAVIVFREGWNKPENSDVKSYTEEGATEFLRKDTTLREMIDGPKACVIEVVKGCHQQGEKAHFTINGTKSKNCNKINNNYMGSKNVHIPCSR
jgi:hypothetical protein